MANIRHAVSVPVSAKALARLTKIAAKSDLPLERWLQLAIESACLSDEAHWKEMDERADIRGQIARTRFGIISQHFSNLPESAFNALADVLTEERQKGRVEGSEAATRLAAVRGARGGVHG